MTENKLPEVGQEYKDKTNDNVVKIVQGDKFHVIIEHNDLDRETYNLHGTYSFYRFYEELPDQTTSAKQNNMKEFYEINYDNKGSIFRIKDIVQMNIIDRDDEFGEVQLEIYFVKSENYYDNQRIHFNGKRNKLTKIYDEIQEFMKEPTSAKSAQVGSEKVEECKNELERDLLEWGDLEDFTLEFYGIKSYIIATFIKAQNLVNALEEQKAETKLECATPEPEIKHRYCDNCPTILGDIACRSSIKSGSFCSVKCAKEPAISKKETTESIWKHISDLPEFSCNLLLRWRETGEISIGNGYEDIVFDEFKQPVKNLYDIKEYRTLTDFVNQQEAIVKNQEIIFAEIAKLKNK
jgi:hypothetical protein